MNDHEGMTGQFELYRGQLRAVAYRMLGSLSEADDAVQETWLRFSRADVSGVSSLEGWLRTVVGRICLDMLRTRRSRREEPLDPQAALRCRSRAVTPSRRRCSPTRSAARCSWSWTG